MPESSDAKPTGKSLLLSRSEAAMYLGISKQTLAIWNCTGRYHVPFVKIGRLVKYRKSDLDTFIANNCRGSLLACARWENRL
jgi:excisionase family DNA binding protein